MQKYFVWSPHLLYACIVVFSAFIIIYAIKFRKYRSNGTPPPPLVPYVIPWMGSSRDMAKDPDAFFEHARSTLGPVFRVKAMGKEIIFVTSPDVISAVYRDANTFDFTPLRLEMTQKVFGMSREAAYSPFLRDYANPIHHHGLLPKNITGLLERYAACSFEEIKKAVENSDNKSTSLKSFLILPAYCSTSGTFFGRTFDAAKSYSYFRKFDDFFHLISAGVPRFILPGPHRAWDTLVSMLERYVQEPHDECCELFLKIESATRDAGWSNQDMARWLSSDLWAMESNTIWVAYWVIVYALQDPQRLARLVAEIDNSRKEWQAAHPDESLDVNVHGWVSSAAFPFLTSMIYETLRLSTSVFSIRRVTKSVVLGGYQLKANQRLICATRSVHLDDVIHQEALEFTADRYMDNRKKFTKNGLVVSNHTMPFGGGVSMCEGRHFAMGALKILIALVLSYATIELDPESSEWPTYSKDRIGGGVMPPKGDLKIRIRKRDVGLTL